MSFYGKYVVPRMIELCMKNPDMTRIRAELPGPRPMTYTYQGSAR